MASRGALVAALREWLNLGGRMVDPDLDFDDGGRVVSLEILDASRVIPQVDRMEFDAVGRAP